MAAQDQQQNDRMELEALVAPWPSIGQLVRLVMESWPEHAGYLKKSFASRSAGMLATSEHVAGAVLALAGDRARQVAADYRWLADRIREEELHFARTGSYRYSTFADANANVYSNDRFMERYMNGLLFSHVLWYMHASSLHFCRGRLEARVGAGGRVLEIGSGHGLLLYLALTDLRMAEAHAWDLSEVSLAQTRAALALLSVGDRAHFAIQDMHKVRPDGTPFDLVILSHILEHLEDPVSALHGIRPALGKNGLLFVNVPLNAPMPDHIVLLDSPDAAVDLLKRGGFRTVELAAHTAQAMSLSQALRRKTAVTCSIIAEAL